jgi:hypothetical protein
MYGALRKVLIPAKCGSSPLENVGIVLSSMEDAPGRPCTRASAISRSKFVRGISASFRAAFHPLVFVGWNGSG